MAGYALVKAGKVINIIVWDGKEMDFGEGVEPIYYEDGEAVSIGYSYADGKFSRPPLTEEEQKEEVASQKAANIAMKVSLMATANQTISVLQDAVDLEMATDEETAALLAWKKYRVLLSRIDANTADDVSWPKEPE